MEEALKFISLGYNLNFAPAAANLFVGEKNNLKRGGVGGNDQNVQYISLRKSFMSRMC